MECDNSEVRRDVFSATSGPVPCLLQFRRSSDLLVGRVARLPSAPPASTVRLPTLANHPPISSDPFMSDMEEISYWIHTKRAPCLMNYDNPIQKQNKAHSSKEPLSAMDEMRSPKKKKKRKLSVLDDDSVSTEHHLNVYFESPKNTRPAENECKLDSLGSDVDFNIKETVRDKCKKAKLHKSSRATVHKKNKVVTSTPKATVNLRRSLRHNKGVNHHLNSSFEIFKSSVTNGTHVTNNIIAVKARDKINQSEVLAGGDQTVDNKRNYNIRNKSKNTAQNGQFDDMSDVSGFTANYIRSTKVLSNKTPRKMRCKSNRNLVKESQQQAQNESNMVVTTNKSINTKVPGNMLNCSTDSSTNLINLVTSKNNDKSSKVNKSTSLLKFMDSKAKVKDGKPEVGRRRKANLNISFQSQSSGTSRYPRRNKTVATNNIAEATRVADKSPSNKKCIEFNNSDKKENPEDKLVSKTRSGRNIGLSVLQRENSVLVVSNSTDPVSSMVSLNVASPDLAQSSKKRQTPARQARRKKSMDKVQSPRKLSLRDRSGFAACFSESDNESEPLVQRKYFCA
ncbi:Uncharacterized protein OBRU01_10407 [Operophtera brumata]|uniref:Uncharacterized protein n=1 Tax=Operophtera brumata TaxID=104452 RepID=A0A0L7LE44_OPEBR|nr:Uncharacterized protein OBRU01_10407 [Operophtera brumata]